MNLNENKSFFVNDMALVGRNEPHGVEYYANLYDHYRDHPLSKTIKFVGGKAWNATRDSARRGSDNHNVAYGLHGAWKFKPRGAAGDTKGVPPTPESPIRDTEMQDATGSKRKLSFSKMNPVTKKFLSQSRAARLKYGDPKAWKALSAAVRRKRRSGRKGPVFGKTKKRIKRRKNKFAKRKWRWSAIERIETGSSVTDAECVYLGHGVPCYKVFQDVIASIYVEGMRLAGVECQSFAEDTVVDITDTGNTHEVFWSYFEDESEQAQTNFIVTLTAGDTPATASTKTLTAMATALGALGDTKSPKFLGVTYLKKNAVTASDRQLVFKMNLQYTKIVVNYSSYMKWQNITKPGLAVPPTGADPGSASNVEAVTLHGRKYVFPHWNNTVNVNKRGTGAGTSSGIVVNGLNGMVKTTATGIGAPSGQFKKPPIPYEINAKKATKVVVPAGKIYRDRLNFRSSMYFNKYVELLLQAIRVNTAAAYQTELKYGNMHLFALEKMLDFRAADNVVEVGFEIDTTLKVGLTYKRPPSKPFVTTQIV